MKIFFRQTASSLLVGMGVLVAASAWAEEPMPVVLMDGGGVVVTDGDVLLETINIPPEARKDVLSKPETVGQIALNIYTRKLLVKQALDAGVEKDMDVQKALAVSREKTLMDAAIVRLDRHNTMPAADAEKVARDLYRSSPKRFETQEQVRVKHILVAMGADSKAAKEKAEAILTELKGGANFEELAKSKSEDPGSAARGGDLGLFGRGKMVKPFEDAAFALKNPGDLSELVESQFGFHILRLVEHKPAALRTFDEVKDDLMAEAQRKAIEEGRKLEAKRIGDSGRLKLDAVQAFSNAKK